MKLVNGDSMTYGQGLSDRSFAWPNLIFKDLKNIAEPGSSNFSIFRRTIEECLLHDFKEIFIGWSSLYRLELGDTYGKPKTIVLHSPIFNIAKEIIINWSNDYWFFKNFLLNLYNLLMFTQDRQIKLECVNFGSDVCEAYKQLSSYTTFKKFFKLEYYTDREIRKEFIIAKKLEKLTENVWVLPPTVDLKKNYLEKKLNVSLNDSHPNASGHILIAEQIKNSLN